MDFGMKLQELRKARGLSQEALALELNVSRQAVSKWESGAGYPEMDKLILLSEMFHVSIDYLIKDHYESVHEEDNDSLYFMNNEKIQEYMTFKKRFALRIGISVSAIILGIVPAILLADSAYETLGIFLLLAIAALSVFGLIYTGITSETYHELEKKQIRMSHQDLQDITDKNHTFQSSFGLSIAFGVCLIIFSVAFIALFSGHLLNEEILAAQLMICVSIAVFLFIYQGIKKSMYEFLVHNEDYIKEAKREENSLFGVTMPLAVMIYLILGFTKNLWHPGWIIFPITAIITTALDKMRMK
ncbi:helix-turn-helix transcriptional regulator [Longibaculum muris]|uniref:helix-turn-helix domain-containing protein n=1 Tax=Longibaculum muris TaxID=1796628 RepID=UPI002942874D|nr:helix-turn-helix transcriptional regulator [Longibaculum muris]